MGGGGGANRRSKRGGDQGGGRGKQRPWRIFGGSRRIGGVTKEDCDRSEEDCWQERGGFGGARRIASKDDCERIG